MPEDDRDILEILKQELNFIEKGGYGRSVKKPWVATSVFQDSPSCLCYPDRTHDDICVLMKLVPDKFKSEGVPCHLIPLNEKGETIAFLENQGNQQQLEETMKGWLRQTIELIENERAGHK